MSDLPNFAEYCEKACIHFWGEPTRATRTQLRWNGSNGYDGKSYTRDKHAWYDRGAAVGGGTIQLIENETGIQDFVAAWQWGYEHGIIPEPPGKAEESKIVSTYDYVSETGDLIFQVVRFEPKKFRQRRKNSAGEWEWNVKGLRRVPYRLPDVQEAIALGRTVYVTEGEKDADTLASFGLAATTNAGGAGKWSAELGAFLAGADVVVLQDNDQPGRDHATAVCAGLAGKASRVRLMDIAKAWPACPDKGDVSDWLCSGGTIEAFNDAVAKLPDWKPEAAPASGGLGEWDAGDDITSIPPRGWLLGNTFCRGFVSSLLADGGTGKTAVRYAQALALATGRKLTGEHVFHRSRVLVVSFEDGTDELRRRIRAAQKHHGVSHADIKGWLYVAAPKASVGRLMKENPKTRRPEVSSLAATLEQTIRAHKIDVVTLDPFVKTHGIAENDNSGMDEVIQLLADLAVRHDIAVDIPHHTSKGLADPGNANRGRGASAVKDGARLVYTLMPMSLEEAQSFGVPENERRQYVRVDPGKVNIAPPPSDAQWFKLVSVSLGNATEQYPSGDNVQTIEPWTPPDAFGGMTVEDLQEVQRKVKNGEWREDCRSPQWVGRVVADVLDLDVEDEVAIRTIKRCLTQWLKNGMLKVVERQDNQRKVKRFVEVNQWA